MKAGVIWGVDFFGLLGLKPRNDGGLFSSLLKALAEESIILDSIDSSVALVPQNDDSVDCFG